MGVYAISLQFIRPATDTDNSSIAPLYRWLSQYGCYAKKAKEDKVRVKLERVSLLDGRRAFDYLVR